MSMLSGQIIARGTALVGTVLGAVLSVLAADIPTVWAHRPYVVQMAVTNHTAAVRRVAKVATSCACLTAKAVDGGGRGATALPGGVIPFELTLNPTGMEGRIAKTGSVTFDDGTVETMTVKALVKTRLALSPLDAAFGVVEPKDMGRTMTAKLKGEIAERAKIVGVKGPEHPFFDVIMAEDRKSVAIRFQVGGGREATALPGGHVETWIVRTDDDEIPVLTFPVSATVSGALKVAPAALMVDEDEGLCARIVTLRPERKSSMVHVLGAETMPRKWGDVVVEKRPLNGWMIRITGIDPRELAQFSKRPYLQVRTDCLEMENFEIPIRVMRKGNGK